MLFFKYIVPVNVTHWVPVYYAIPGPPLLTGLDFNPSMDK